MIEIKNTLPEYCKDCPFMDLEAISYLSVESGSIFTCRHLNICRHAVEASRELYKEEKK